MRDYPNGFITGCGLETGSAKQVKAFEGKQVQEVVIKTEGQNISVRPSSSQEVKVSIDADKEVPMDLNGGVLSIELGSSSNFINFKNSTLHVELPSQAYRKLSLITASGQITGEELRADELQLSTDSGDIKINGYDGSQITGEVAAGSIDLKNVNGNIVLNNDTGNIKISHNGKIGKESVIRTETGSVDFAFENKPASLQLDVSTESGSIKSSLTSPEDIIPKGAGSRLNAVIGSEDGGVPLLTIRSSSGSINLK